jgi:hypothetical protein
VVCIVDLIDDAVLALSYAISVVLIRQLFASTRPRLVSEALNSFDNLTADLLGLDRFNLLRRGRLQPKAIFGHGASGI